MLAVKWARKRQRGSNQGEVQQGPDASEPFGVNESRSTLSDSSENGLVDHENEYEMTSDHHSTRNTGIDGHCSECEICDHGGELLCCDTCRRTYHLTCLHPPPKHTPNGKWICPACCLECNSREASVAEEEVRVYTAAGRAHKEKFSRLCAKQKERLAHRAAVGASDLLVPSDLERSSPNDNQKPEKPHEPRTDRSDDIQHSRPYPAIDLNEPANDIEETDRSDDIQHSRPYPAIDLNESANDIEETDVAASPSPKSKLPHWLRAALAEGSRKT